MFGLFTLIEASLLFLNAVAVLHEERFLKKFGFADDTHQGFGEPGMKVWSQSPKITKSVTRAEPVEIMNDILF